MLSPRGQSSLEYILLISGVILIGIVVLFVILESAVPQAQSILQANIEQNTDATDAAGDVVLVPLTEINLSAVGEDGTVVITYSAPGASKFLLVQESDGDGNGSPTVVDTLDTPESFATITPDLNTTLFSLPFFATTVESAGTENCTTYFYRLRACDEEGFCLVSSEPVITATPEPDTGCS